MLETIFSVPAKMGIHIYPVFSLSTASFSTYRFLFQVLHHLHFFQFFLFLFLSFLELDCLKPKEQVSIMMKTLLFHLVGNTCT